MAIQWEHGYLSRKFDSAQIYIVSVLWRQAGRVGMFVVEAPADYSGGWIDREHDALARDAELDFIAVLGDEGWEMISVGGQVKWFKRVAR
jgi:hypothetical protein